jgi:hypothetical protein
MARKALWEILIPKCNNEGTYFLESHHAVWKREIIELSKGLTVLACATGYWPNLDYPEPMMPVRFMATNTEADKVMEFTQGHYRQQVVMCYKIADSARFYPHQKDMGSCKLKGFISAMSPVFATAAAIFLSAMLRNKIEATGVK